MPPICETTFPLKRMVPLLTQFQTLQPVGVIPHNVANLLRFIKGEHLGLWPDIFSLSNHLLHTLFSLPPSSGSVPHPYYLVLEDTEVDDIHPSSLIHSFSDTR